MFMLLTKMMMEVDAAELSEQCSLGDDDDDDDDFLSSSILCLAELSEQCY